MDQIIRKWLFDPTVGRLVSALLGIVVVYAVVHVLQRAVSRYVQETDTRYRVRKALSFLGISRACSCWRAASAIDSAS